MNTVKTPVSLRRPAALVLLILAAVLLVSCGGEPKADLYSVSFNGQTLSIRAPFPGTEKLGQPDSMEASASCYYEGMDHLYVYGDLRITTYPKDGEHIASLELTGPGQSLGGKITVGSTLADVKAAYGEGEPDRFGRLVYENDGIKLTFLFDREEKVERALVLLPTNAS